MNKFAMRRISTYAKRLCRFLPAGAFVLLAAGIAPLAAQPDETYNFNPGRPGFTYGSTPLIRHTISAEAYVRVEGYTAESFKHGGALLNRYTFRYSPLDRLELGVGVGLYAYAFSFDKPVVDLSALSLMARVNILRKSGLKPGLALIGELGLPAGSKSYFFVEPGVKPSAVIVLDHNYKRFGFFYNVGAEWSTAYHATSLFYAVMVCYGADAAGRINLYGDFVGSHTWNLQPYYMLPQPASRAKYDRVRTNKLDDTFVLRVGADFFITKAFKLDCSFATNLQSPHSLQGEIGLAYGIPLKKLKR